jgi:hypothetical protein
VTKTKKHILTFEQEYDFELIGICSHHNDYRLAWGINEKLGVHLEKSEDDHLVMNKKGLVQSNHSKYVFKDEENLTEFYLVRNKSLGKYLIPEKPTIDYFLFIYENHLLDVHELVNDLKEVTSVLGAFVFDPEELESTEHIVFN